MKKTLLIPAIISIVFLIACNGVPSDIVQPEQMSLLMADVHTAEAVIDQNRATFYNDSLRQTFRQSVLRRHNVTGAQFDSSLAWYGRHIDRYITVYDRTIEILERRIDETGSRITADASLSIAGDSVDIWPGARFISIGPLSPTRTVTFAFNRDRNWRRGDLYTWRAKFFNNPGDDEWLIGVDYADGSTEWHTERTGGDGTREIRLQTDSTRHPVRIYGYLSTTPRGTASIRIDSMQMIRRRLNPHLYGRPYFIHINNFNNPVEVDYSSDNGSADSPDES